MTADVPASQALLIAARNLHVDAGTVEVLDALQDSGIQPILLKGPAVANWVNVPYVYVDSDILVSPRDFSAAERVLGEIGFTNIRDSLPPDALATGLTYAHVWSRPDGARVDLHQTLQGVGAPPDDVWEMLRGETVKLTIARRSVDALNRVATALMLALHAAAHGAEQERPLVLLSRALEDFEPSAWVDAAALARRLDATAAFVAGLALVPSGRHLARQLELPEDVPVGVALRAATAPKGAHAFEQLVRAPGVRARLEIVARRLAPPRAFMEFHFPIAKRGLAGLLAAYVWRTVTLPWLAVPAFRAWRRARRRSAMSGEGSF